MTVTGLGHMKASGRLLMTMGLGFCPQCGTPLAAATQFCGSCGKDVSALTGAASAIPMAPPSWNAPVQPNTLYPEPPAQPGWPGSPDQQYPPSYPGAPYGGAPYPGAPYPGAYGPPQARSNTPLIVAGVGLVLLLVAGVIGVVALSGNKGSVGAGPSSSVASSTPALSLEPTPTDATSLAATIAPEPTPTVTPAVATPTPKFGTPTAGRQVYDNGGLLTTSDISKLEASAASIQNDFACNVWMVTEVADTSEITTSAKVQSDLDEIRSEWSASLGSCYFITLIISDRPTTHSWWWSYSSSSKADATFWNTLSPAVQPYLNKSDFAGVFTEIMTRFGQALAG